MNNIFSILTEREKKFIQRHCIASSDVYDARGKIIKYWQLEKDAGKVEREAQRLFEKYHIEKLYIIIAKCIMLKNSLYARFKKL